MDEADGGVCHGAGAAEGRAGPPASEIAHQGTLPGSGTVLREEHASATKSKEQQFADNAEGRARPGSRCEARLAPRIYSAFHAQRLAKEVPYSDQVEHPQAEHTRALAETHAADSAKLA